MATCPFCAEEIKDAAIVCKHCGRNVEAQAPTAGGISYSAHMRAYEANDERPGSNRVFLNLIWLFIVSIFMFLAYLEFGPTVPVSEGRADRAVAEPPPVEITAIALMGAYEANELAADRDYKDRVMLVSGTVESIGNDFLGEPYVSLNAFNQVFTVQAFFERNRDEGLLAELTAGQRLTVRCRGDGMLGNVLLRDCSMP